MDTKKLKLLKDYQLNKLIQSEPIFYYSVFGGIDAGYGYFAPRIGRSITLECVRNRSDSSQVKIYYPKVLKTYEGIQRYSVSISNLYTRINEVSDTSRRRTYFEMATKSIGKKLIQEDRMMDVNSTEITYSYFVFPTIIDLQKGKKPTIVNLIKVKL